jgi:uncharacterized membrane protein YvlD (DUF360 family)
MWIFILLMWRIVGRLLRRAGWGGLLVPVAAMGMALAGVHFWTVALVLIALAVVLRKPLLAAALLPLSMVFAGLSGLVVAAMTPGGSVSYFVRSVVAKPLTGWVALPQAVAGYAPGVTVDRPAKGGPLTAWVGPKGGPVTAWVGPKGGPVTAWVGPKGGPVTALVGPKGMMR